MRELQARVRSTEAQLSPLRARIHALEAERDTAAQELAAAKEQADRWQKRAQQLMQKYDSVDQAEHQRVLAELKEVQDRVRAAEKAAAVKAAEAAAATAALESERAALAAAQQQLEASGKENTGEVERLQAELAKSKVRDEAGGERSTPLRAPRALAPCSVESHPPPCTRILHAPWPPAASPPPPVGRRWKWTAGPGTTSSWSPLSGAWPTRKACR